MLDPLNIRLLPINVLTAYSVWRQAQEKRYGSGYTARGYRAYCNTVPLRCSPSHCLICDKGTQWIRNFCLSGYHILRYFRRDCFQASQVRVDVLSVLNCDIIAETTGFFLRPRPNHPVSGNWERGHCQDPQNQGTFSFVISLLSPGQKML